MQKLLLPAALLLVLFSNSCRPEGHGLEEEEAYALDLPVHFPPPAIPADNQLTEARVALGQRLFHDPILSADSTVSCVSCHKPGLAFADSLPVSPGIEGRLGFRNSPSLMNVAYLGLVNKDGGVPKLDLQPIVPIEEEAEMGLHILAAAGRLNAQPHYREAFLLAYGEEATPFTITRALASFLRTLISGNSLYDQYLQGQRALSPAAEKGKALFFSERTQCSSCHAGFNFTDNSFRNNGLYTSYEDKGRQRVTGRMQDIGKFRVPSLRNAALTAPYMHDGSLPDLRAVLQHYNRGGSGHANQDSLIRPLGLKPSEISELEAFLHSLTDEAFRE